MTILRNILAVIAGCLVESVVNMGIVAVGMMVIPLPEGIDFSDGDKFAENLKSLRPANFVAPWLAHALGTLAGAFIAAKVAASHKMKFAISMGVLFLFGGMSVVLMYGGPIWFTVLDLVGAYLPMGYLGGILGGAKKQPSK